MEMLRGRFTRREFVAGVAAQVTLVGSGKKALAEVTASQLAIDTHSHVFHRGLKLASGRRYAPDYDAPLSLYLQQLDQNGTTNGVLVQPSFLGTDNSYLVECVKQTNGRLRGIAVVDAPISGVLEQNIFYVNQIMKFGKFFAVFQVHPSDADKTVVTAFMTLAIKARVLDEKREFEKVPVLRNLVPAQVLMGQSSFNSGESISAGLPKYARNEIKTVASLLQTN